MDYYTGTVLETTLDDLPGIGSVASGGRYDNLVAVYSAQPMPGIGASLGLDRLLAAMEELKLIEPVRTPADVLVVYFDEDRLAEYLRLAAAVRTAGHAVSPRLCVPLSQDLPTSRPGWESSIASRLRTG